MHRRSGMRAAWRQALSDEWLQGRVVNDVAYLTQIGSFEVDVAIEGRVVLVRQRDQPGLIAAVANVLAEDNVNVAYMTVSRETKGETAIMCLGVDDAPSEEALKKLPQIPGIIECGLFKDL
jgi:D-3-phosphoglycerate dehydrogenase / 2-oxoglutarate reductase